jgi:hypothetical protein
MAGFDFDDPSGPVESLANTHELRSALLRSELARADLSTRLNLAIAQLADERLTLTASEVESARITQLRGLEADTLRSRVSFLQSQLIANESEIATFGLKSKALLSLASAHFDIDFPTVDSLISFFENTTAHSLRTKKKKHARRNEMIESKERIIEEQAAEIESLKEQLESVADEVVTFEAIPEGFSHRLKRDLREVLEDRRVSVNDRVRFALNMVRSQKRRRAQAKIVAFKAIPDGLCQELQKELEEILEDRKLSVNDRVRFALNRALRSAEPEAVSFDAIPDGLSPGVQNELRRVLDDGDLSINDRFRSALKIVMQVQKTGNDSDEVVTSDVIPVGLPPAVQSDLKEILENRDLSVTDKIRLALKKLVPAQKSHETEKQIVKVAESLIPEFCRIVLGQACDARTFAASPILPGELTTRLVEWDNARTAQDAELRGKTKKLAYLRQNLKQLNRQMERETARVIPPTSEPPKPKKKSPDLNSDEPGSA